MALTTTSTSATFSKNSLDFNATSATGATVGGFVRINDEWMFITEISGTKISVRSRGSYGSMAKDHDTLSVVEFGLASDIAELGMLETIPVSNALENQVAIGQNGTIPVPTRNTCYTIQKGAALAASAMANPSKSQDGLEVQFLSNTDFAHVVTLVTSQDGTTGNHTTYTFPAFGGSSFRVKALGGRWLVIGNNLVVIT